MALRRINFVRITKVLLTVIAVFIAVTPLFLPTEVFAQGGSRDLDCTLSKVGECVQIAAGGLMQTLVAVAGWILYWVAMLFESTLSFSIMTKYNDLQAVRSGWIMLRDIVNLLFIFILLYIAIGTVLRLESVNWKKQLAAIIIAAVLVNFSLFLTRVVIDASNIVALGIYNRIILCEEDESSMSTESVCSNSAGEGTITITEALMNNIGLPKTFSEQIFSEEKYASDGLRNSFIRLGLISLVIWAFLSVALLFIVRSIVFVFLLVTSPIGVGGASLPMLQQPAKQWRDNLFNQALVAPVFLILIYIVLIISADLLSEDVSERFSFEGEIDNQDNSLFWLNFVLLLGFIIAAVNITKRYSGEAGKMINKAAGAVVGAAVGVGLGVATGGAALAARSAIGGAATRTLANEELKASARGGNRMAQMRLDAANTLSRQSFDVRQTSFGKSAMKGLQKRGITGVGVTQQAGKGGIEGTNAAYAKKSTERKERYDASKEYETEQGSIAAAPEQERLIKLADHQQRTADRLPEGDAMRAIKLKQVRELRERAAAQPALETQKYRAAEQQRFANSLTQDSWWKRARRKTHTDSFGNMDRRNARAAEAIRKKENMSETEKMLEALKQNKS